MPEERADFSAHLATCPGCTQLVERVGGVLQQVHTLEMLKPPPQLIRNILDRTLGPRTREKRGWFFWFPTFLQPRFAIGLGCEIRHAAKLVYATGMDLEKTEGTPIGVNCRLCERENCSQRAEPPITRTLILDENTRRVSSFAFSNAREL